MASLVLWVRTMNVTRFRQMIRTLLLSAVPAASLACSTSDVTVMPLRAACVDMNAPSRYSRLTLGPSVDGIALATRGKTDFSSQPAAAPALVRIDPLGTPCAKASDRDACAKQVDALLSASDSRGWSVYVTSSCGDCGSTSLSDVGVSTTGDAVKLVSLDDVVRAALPVDALDEAAAVLALKGYAFDCDQNNARPESDGWTFKNTSSSCSGASSEHFWKVTQNGEVIDGGSHVVSEADNNCIEGRRPANLVPTGVPWLSSVSACFAEIAHMEAAAVDAFSALESQLRALGAPDELVDAVLRAQADEVEHARMTTALAHRFGGRPVSPRVESSRDPFAPDARLRLALENAVEGCVREAYGALVAAWQATRSEDAAVRTAFATIAVDEASHAELSFALDAWLATQLSAEERLLVENAKAQAWLDLDHACRIEPARDVVRVAGMPTAREARALLAQLHTVACEDLAA